MKKVVFSLFLAAVGFSPAFAAEVVAVKTEPKKADEMPAKPVAQEKKEGGALLIAAMSDQSTCPAKKDASKEEQKKAQQQKTEAAPKA